MRMYPQHTADRLNSRARRLFVFARSSSSTKKLYPTVGGLVPLPVALVTKHPLEIYYRLYILHIIYFPKSQLIFSRTIEAHHASPPEEAGSCLLHLALSRALPRSVSLRCVPASECPSPPVGHPALRLIAVDCVPASECPSPPVALPELRLWWLLLRSLLRLPLRLRIRAASLS